MSQEVADRIEKEWCMFTGVLRQIRTGSNMLESEATNSPVLAVNSIDSSKAEPVTLILNILRIAME